MSVLLSQCRITERHQEFLARTQDGNKRTTKTKQKNFKWSKQRKPHDNSEPSGIVCLNWAVKSLLSSSKYRRHSHTTYMIPCLSSRGFFFPTAFRLFPYLFPLTPSEAPRIFYVLGGSKTLQSSMSFCVGTIWWKFPRPLEHYKNYRVGFSFLGPFYHILLHLSLNYFRCLASDTSEVPSLRFGGMRGHT